MKKLVVGYLTYITEKNYSYRQNDFETSLKTFEQISDYDYLDVLSIDNASLEFVRNSIPPTWKKFHYGKNLYDISLFFTTVWYAKENNIPYVAFTYDDFILEDPKGFQDVIQFMDENPEVHCTRITAYDFANNFKYDSSRTAKQSNPDAVRHFNDVTNEALRWSDRIDVNSSSFYKNNWHYTSRPCVWRTDVFFKAIEDASLQNVPVLQAFEGWAKGYFQKFGLVTGVMDIGLMRTTDVRRSARTNELNLDKEMSLRIPREDLRQEFRRMK